MGFRLLGSPISYTASHTQPCWKTVKVIAEHLYEDGKKRRLTTRLCIPQDLRQAFGGRKHLQAALGTSDVAEGKRLHAVKLATFYAEFEARRVKLREQQAERLARASTPLTTLSADQVEMLAGHFIHQSLLTDDNVRSQGLDDEDFDALGQELQAQRSALGGLLARGRVELVMPALRGFMHLMGTEIALAPGEERRVGLAFLQSVVRALDLRISRQAGNSVSASESVPAQSVEAAQAALRTAAQGRGPAPAASAGPGLTWDGLFDLWRTHVSGRPESTTIAMNTAWRDLQRAHSADLGHSFQADRGQCSGRWRTPPVGCLSDGVDGRPCVRDQRGTAPATALGADRWGTPGLSTRRASDGWATRCRRLCWRTFAPPVPQPCPRRRRSLRRWPPRWARRGRSCRLSRATVVPSGLGPLTPQ